MWKFFDVMDRVLLHRPASQAPVVIGTNDDNSDDADDFSYGLELNPVINNESQDEHAGGTRCWWLAFH